MNTNNRKKLYRSRDDRIIGGVAGGVGDYFNMDPLMIRLAFLGIAALSHLGPALLAYFVAWILIPSEKISEAGGADKTEK